MAGSEQVGPRRRRPRPLRRRHLGAHPDRHHRPRRLRPFQARRQRPRGRRRGPGPGRPRPLGGHGLPRAPPGGRHPDERRRRPGAEEDAALLRLAAGGFRDMTRVAAGHPGIWPDVCADNAPAIVAALDTLLADLAAMRDRVAGGRPGRRSSTCSTGPAPPGAPAGPGRPARAPGRAPGAGPRPPRVLAEITTLAGDLGVNIYDIEIAHSAEGRPRRARPRGGRRPTRRGSGTASPRAATGRPRRSS